MSLYGVDLHAQGKQMVLHLQLQAKRMGPLAIRRIEFHFQNFDPSLSGLVMLSEAHEALNASGFFPSVAELQALYKNFQDAAGMFHYADFIFALRPKLSARAKEAIARAFAAFGSKAVGIARLVEAYQPEASQLYVSGSASAEAAKEEFGMLIKAHAGVDGESAVIDEAAWTKFYQDLRLCLPSDDYLAQNLEASWGISEPGRQLSKAEVDQGILRLKSALMQGTTGLKDEVKLRSFIRQWNPSGRVDVATLYELYIDVGVDATPALASAVLERVDLERTGAVELESLVAIVCGEDPRWSS
jgi:Ca2+-binding EF-hand superfamily protein